MSEKFKISIIFSTYNSEAWLEKVLWGFSCQSDTNFEIVIADDGSKNPTKALIERFKNDTSLSIQHIWQEDDGFQKCKILNKAILAAKGDYLIFTDGDCIPRADFVEVHRKNAEPGHFLSGGYFKLPMGTSTDITQADIESQRCFDAKWLENNGVKRSHKFMKFTKSPLLASIYNLLTPTKRTWNGHNASCFKEAALAVNGYDERLRYGGLDVEFGTRLKNSGLIAKQIRYKAIVIHLDHSRGYVNQEDLDRNMQIRNNSIKTKVKKTQYGTNLHL